jgi:hypothetical protein
MTNRMHLVCYIRIEVTISYSNFAVPAFIQIGQNKRRVRRSGKRGTWVFYTFGLQNVRTTR